MRHTLCGGQSTETFYVTKLHQPLFRTAVIQLHDGCYARAKLDVHAGGDIFVVLESYLNPAPGHRNLEFDPKKAIQPKP